MGVPEGKGPKEKAKFCVQRPAGLRGQRPPSPCRRPAASVPSVPAVGPGQWEGPVLSSRPLTHGDPGHWGLTHI